MALSKLRQVIVAWGRRCVDRWDTVRKRRGQGEEGDAAHRARRHRWGQRPSSAPDDRGQPPPHGGKRRGAQLGAEEARKANASLSGHPRRH
eukprot:6212342-Pleurochrysis_carterae.AAC.2